MNEHAEKIKKTLEELHAELSQVDSLDPEIRRLLETSLEEIQVRLAQPKSSHARPTGLATQLSDTVAHFEETHPQLTASVRNVIDVLRQMGI